ncbi:MAG: hypothetical protein MAG795_00175 [Candidatus Woesearchaeota archaeon]|nr:hypothetical protein [Candidatus Woesearchaeota archaeon]
MLKNTFQHVPGVGCKTEQKIWKNNVLDWDTFMSSKRVGISSGKRTRIARFLETCSKHIDENNHKFLLDHFPDNQQWRVYPDTNVCFLDIETTGLSRHYHDITTIGLFDGKKSKVFIQGKNLDKFADEFQKFNTVVTFNGKCFDIPFISQKFPDTDVNKFHIDLRYVMRRLGYSGGLKLIERAVGIERDDDLKEVDGYEAVRLWKRYQRGDDDALDLLIKYNIADIENLKVLMDLAFKRMKNQVFLPYTENKR